MERRCVAAGIYRYSLCQASCQGDHNCACVSAHTHVRKHLNVTTWHKSRGPHGLIDPQQVCVEAQQTPLTPDRCWSLGFSPDCAAFARDTHISHRLDRRTSDSNSQLGILIPPWAINVNSLLGTVISSSDIWSTLIWRCIRGGGGQREKDEGTDG